ncbi:hypothetical protein ACFS7Z_06380 [Pontibacter toksunensis]|uniref:Beta-lactamase inhibitor (BLIP) n=1 Tax=Pontibacter toksunensis TaxID=1332631 RepID=A0ABW6BT52_9BACT
MKKATVLAIAIATCGMFSIEARAQSAEAPSTQLPQATEQVQLETGKLQITAEELPDGVKKALKSNVLKEWQVSEIYKVTPVAAARPTYEVLFTNAEQKRAIARFNEEGMSVEGAGQE